MYIHMPIYIYICVYIYICRFVTSESWQTAISMNNYFYDFDTLLI